MSLFVPILPFAPSVLKVARPFSVLTVCGTAGLPQNHRGGVASKPV